MGAQDTAQGRPAPPLTDRTRDYWLSGRDGVLRLATCQACGYRLHPPKPICPRCRGRNIRFAPVSGRGRVSAWTINRYAWNPALPPPYVIADVELEEQEGLVILSNIVDCAPEDLRVGLPVRVAFEQVGEVYVPVFRP